MSSAPAITATTIEARCRVAVSDRARTSTNSNGSFADITGATSGIGRRTAEEFVREGAKVVATGRREELGRTLEASLGKDKCIFVKADATREADVKAVFEACLAKWGKLDCLFNNAGGQFPAPAAAMSAKGFDVVVRNNLTGGFIVSREVFTQSMEKHGGAIVNMTADYRNGFPNMVHTGAARAGMANLTMTLAYEWAVSGVRVNSVAPGWIASSGLDQYPAEMREHIRALPKRVPLGRLGTESEVSAAIVFLLSPAAAFISGACLRVDGAAPNAKRIWPQVGTGGTTPEFNGFHLARRPKVLDDPA